MAKYSIIKGLLFEQPAYYQIINTENGRIYHGSSANVHRRRLEHLSELRTGKHENPQLQADWDKYGDVFEFIVEVTGDKPEAEMIEARNIERDSDSYNYKKVFLTDKRGRERRLEYLREYRAANKDIVNARRREQRAAKKAKAE